MLDSAFLFTMTLKVNRNRPVDGPKQHPSILFSFFLGNLAM
jgi:hypothetical protein